MPTKTTRKSYKTTKKLYQRRYRKEHPEKVAEYNRKTSLERSSRNKARRKVAKAKGKAAIKGKEIHHVSGNPSNNSMKNLRVVKKHHGGGPKKKKKKS